MKLFAQESKSQHPFIAKPHKTVFILSIPVLFSLVAEPVTGLVDTAFIARLGTAPLAALGVGAVLLSSVFWIFSFLSVGSQTEVGQALGRHEQDRAAEIGAAALLTGLSLGVCLVLTIWWCVPSLVNYMGAEQRVYTLASQYVRIRLFGAPAILMTIAAFGIMRGLQDMRAPLWIAVAVNLMNIILDAVLIFGIGPFPAMGVAGAALATVLSQWIGFFVVAVILYKNIGYPKRLRTSDIRRLFQIGSTLVIRTGLLLFYTLMVTRAATRIGTETGAAHQAIRQFWTFTTLFLDAYAVTGQSLIAFFMGRNALLEARNVSKVICFWSLITGGVLTIVMMSGQALVIKILVPPEAIGIFSSAWLIAALSQPMNALAFATDGVHWGTGDFAYLRNAMIVATSIGLLGIYVLETHHIATLRKLWLITVLWITIRSFFGMIRVWPGIGKSPLKIPAGK